MALQALIAHALRRLQPHGRVHGAGVVDDVHLAFEVYVGGAAQVAVRLGDRGHDVAGFDATVQVAPGEAGQVGVHVELDGAGFSRIQLQSREAEEPADPGRR